MEVAYIKNPAIAVLRNGCPLVYKMFSACRNRDSYEYKSKGKKKGKEDLEASNGVGGDGGVGAAHVRRGIDVIKRGGEDERLHLG